MVYDIVCLWHTISYVTISYVKTYDIVLRHRILGHTISYALTYDVATYDIVCLTYDVVCNIRWRIVHIRCRILQIVYDIVCSGQHIVRSRLHIVCDIAYDIVYDISIDLIRGIRNSKLHSISGSRSTASASTTMLFNNWPPCLLYTSDAADD